MRVLEAGGDLHLADQVTTVHLRRPEAPLQLRDLPQGSHVLIARQPATDRLGSIETGKTANVVVTDGDILEPRTNIKYLFINGRMLPLTSRHTELFDSFKDRK